MGDKQGRDYEIKPRPESLGGGWKLALLQDGQEAGGGVFPVPEDAAETLMGWWHSMPDTQRRHWVKVAGSDIPANVRYAFLLAEARNDAEIEGEKWVGF